MSDPNPALDDIADGDEFAGEVVEPEHDVDISKFSQEEDDDE